MTERADPKIICLSQLGQRGKLLKQGNLEGELLGGKIDRKRLYLQF